MSQNVPRSSETLLRTCTLHAEVRILAVYYKSMGPAHQVNELDGCQNAQTRVAAIVLMEKNKTSRVL